VIGDWLDFILVMALLTINAMLGYYEQRTSSAAINALKSQLAPTAITLRNSEWTERPAFQLVPGDIVRLKLGNVVPADVKLLEGEGMKVDQSSLTGERISPYIHIFKKMHNNFLSLFIMYFLILC